MITLRTHVELLFPIMMRACSDFLSLQTHIESYRVIHHATTPILSVFMSVLDKMATLCSTDLPFRQYSWAKPRTECGVYRRNLLLQRTAKCGHQTTNPAAFKVYCSVGQLSINTSDCAYVCRAWRGQRRGESKSKPYVEDRAKSICYRRHGMNFSFWMARVFDRDRNKGLQSRRPREALSLRLSYVCML